MSYESIIPESYKFIKEGEIIEHNNEKIKLIFIEKFSPLKVYYEKNKEKISKQKSERFKDKYANDPEFREKMKQRTKDNYLKKKELKEKSI
jgi:hypothetical protein